MARKKPSPKPPQPPAAEDLGLTEFRDAPADEGVSLDSLSAAFAEMLGKGSDPYDDVPAPATAADDPVAELAEQVPKLESPEDRDAACEISPRTILEAMLFVGDPDDAPISAEWVAGLMRGVRPNEVDDLVAELNDQYRTQNRPYEIVSEGKGFRTVLRPEFQGLRDKFLGRDKAVRLSQAAVEVLSVVAYRGALTAEEVGKLRGRPSGAILTQLVRRQLLRLERAEGVPRKQAKFVPTKRFLDLFGLDSLDDLPRGQT
jgi:segregation and condensation protein B